MGCDALLLYCEREPANEEEALASCARLCDVYPMAPEAELTVARVPPGTDPAEAARRLGAHIVHVKSGNVAEQLYAFGRWHIPTLLHSLAVRRETRVADRATVTRYKLRLCTLCPLSGVVYGPLAPPCSPRVSTYVLVAPFLLEPVVNVAKLLEKPVDELLAPPAKACRELGLDGHECDELAERYREMRRWLEALDQLPDSVKKRLYIVKWC